MSSLWLENKILFKDVPQSNLNFDVCIVGAGIFGMTCAYYLTKLRF